MQLIQDICRFRLLYNGTVKNSKIVPNGTLYEIFQWPEPSDRVLHSITRIEAVDKGKGCEIYVYTGGPGNADVELHILTTKKGKGFEIDIKIYGYIFEMID